MDDILKTKDYADEQKNIKKLGENHTVILSSHILSEVSQICSRVVIINHGRIVAVDTPDNLESTSSEEDIIIVTVEDPDNNMAHIKSKIPGCKEVRRVKVSKDGTVQYKIVSDKGTEVPKAERPKKRLFKKRAKQLRGCIFEDNKWKRRRNC